MIEKEYPVEAEDGDNKQETLEMWLSEHSGFDVRKVIWDPEGDRWIVTYQAASQS